jgi:hypothetical protein
MPPRKKKLTTASVEDAPKVKKIKRLQTEKNEYQKVQLMLQSQGWTEVAQPLLDKMITDTIGGIGKNGLWVAGIIGQGKGFSTEYLLGYRMALMEFNNRLKEKGVMAKKVDDQITDLKTKRAVVSTSWQYMPQQKEI